VPNSPALLSSGTLMPFLDASDIRIYYETAGATGPWVTLVNGYSRPGDDFRVMARHLSRHGMRVLYLDNRGAGQTQASLDFHFSDFVDDVVRLWDALEIRQSHLLGISLGGV